MANSAPAQLVVVDRRRFFRDGLTRLLGSVPHITVVGAVARAESLSAVDEPFRHVVTDAQLTITGVAVLQYDGASTLNEIVAMVAGGGTRTEGVVAPPMSAAARRTLTPREIDVLRGIADGMSRAEIAAGLEIAPKSVDNHKQRIFGKLSVHSQAHAVMAGIAQGLLTPLPPTRTGVLLPGHTRK